MKDEFELFLETVEEKNKEFVKELHEFLLHNNCKCEIKKAKSGYLTAYVFKDSNKTLANFVTRKSGMKIRLYLEHIAMYQDILDDLPETMKKEIKKASVCKRLLNPEDCNPKCSMGYIFTMDDETYQKCRYMAFMPALNEHQNPFIKRFLEEEILHR